MPKEYTKEQLWKLFEKLPEELKEAISSNETADFIWDICKKNEIDEITKITQSVGNVLLGILPIDEFQGLLEEDLKLKKDISKKVSQEINRFIFYPVRTELEKLYQTGGVISAKSTEAAIPKTAPVEQIKPELPKSSDVYREPVE
ncbi:MAG: hypothetical protein HYT19_01235 [Candidatus Nealsonbacteria bacterium]|nr:hypothetical protein [Candidatus Nealsonbacteria bacterium]